MEETVRRAVERAIGTMRANLGEPLTIEDLARSAMFSKFHFCRIFRQATGTSPARFLSALRLAEAKRLLRSTSMTVTRICHQVGYSSVGTFSTQFNLRVGTAPNSYRHFGSFAPVTPNVTESGTAVRGNVTAPHGIPSGAIFVGLFPTRIAEGKPIRHVVLDRPGAYALTGVPEGDWQLLAHLIEPADVPYIGWRGAITIRPDLTARLADIAMRPICRFDPPVLIALPQPRIARAGSGQLAVSAG